MNSLQNKATSSRIEWIDTARGFAMLLVIIGHIYISKELIQHRIHEESETSNLIENNVRLEEDLIMLEKYWPKPIAKFIMKFYKNAIKTNQI